MSDALDWDSLVVPLRQEEIRDAIADRGWQDFRMGMTGLPLDSKYRLLQRYLIIHDGSRATQVQVANYVNALKRGGLVK